MHHQQNITWELRLRAEELDPTAIIVFLCFLIEPLSINMFDQKLSEFKSQLLAFWLTISSGSKLPDLTDKIGYF